MSDETDVTSEAARVRYVEAQPDSGPHRPAMPAHYRIEFADGTFWAIAANFLIRQGAPKPQEAQIAAQEPAGATQGGSGDSRASGGLGEQLRALIPETYSDDGYFGVTALEIGEFADEVERLEEKHARQAQTIGELQMVRERLVMVRELAGAIRETSHCSHLATDIETLLDTPLSELRALGDAP